MNTGSIIIIIIICLISILFEYKLIVEGVFPWDILSSIADSLPLVVHDIILPANLQCKLDQLGGTVQDYMGNVVNVENSINCSVCAKYVSRINGMCSQLQFNGTTCEKYGDPRPCI